MACLAGVGPSVVAEEVQAVADAMRQECRLLWLQLAEILRLLRRLERDPAPAPAPPAVPLSAPAPAPTCPATRARSKPQNMPRPSAPNRGANGSGCEPHSQEQEAHDGHGWRVHCAVSDGATRRAPRDAHLATVLGRAAAAGGPVASLPGQIVGLEPVVSEDGRFAQQSPLEEEERASWRSCRSGWSGAARRAAGVHPSLNGAFERITTNSGASLQVLDDMVTGALLMECGLLQLRPAQGQPVPHGRRSGAGDARVPTPSTLSGVVPPLETPAPMASQGPALQERPSFCPQDCPYTSEGSMASAGSCRCTFGDGDVAAPTSGVPFTCVKFDQVVPVHAATVSMEELDQAIPQVRRLDTRHWTFSDSRSAWNMESLRAEHESMLVLEAMDRQPAASRQRRCLHRLPQYVLALFAVVPLEKGAAWSCHGLAICAAAAAAVLYSGARAAQEPEGLYPHAATACLALGGLLGLLLLWARGIHNELGPWNRPLVMYADARGFSDRWAHASAGHLAAVVAIWAVSVVCKAMGSSAHFDCQENSATPLALTVFALAHALTAVLVYCQLHLCCGFGLAVDGFCLRLFKEADLEKGIYEWNILQAMLRRAAGAVDACLLTLGTSVLGVLLLTLREVLSGSTLSSLSRASGLTCTSLWAGWVLPPAALIFYAVLMGAAVTEKCLRLPSLANSVLTGGDRYVNYERQFFVQYVVQSSAGWYVGGVRVSAMWALKVSYLFVVVAFTLISRSWRGLGPHD